MQTFNLFPELFTFSLIAPLILRVVLGFIFLNLGSLKLGKEKPGWTSSMEILNIKPAGFFVSLLGIIEIAGGLLLIAGAYTQITALILGAIALMELFIEYKEESILKRDFPFYLLLTAICASLLLTGAGLFAIDIPIL
jgi:putative oxidoreductase